MTDDPFRVIEPREVVAELQATVDGQPKYRKGREQMIAFDDEGRPYHCCLAVMGEMAGLPRKAMAVRCSLIGPFSVEANNRFPWLDQAREGDLIDANDNHETWIARVIPLLNEFQRNRDKGNP